MRLDKEEFVFATGRRVSFHRGIVGLSPEGDVYEGYDGGVPFYSPDDFEDGLTPAECVELADYMLARWQDFRAKWANHGL